MSCTAHAVYDNHDGMNIESLMKALHPATKISDFPVTVRHLQALLFLATQDKPIDQGAARRKLGYHGPCMSRSLDALGILGFAKRERSEFDRRKLFIRITPEGRKFVGSMVTP
jgi:DNA-binding MarR family transcriptional regulator